MSLPSLAGLSLGPPTGPMAQFGKEVLEPPSSDGPVSKRTRGNDGLTVNIVKWDASNEEEQVCPISLRKFVPGEWVYKLPPPFNPTPFDPWTIHRAWMEEDGSGDDDHRFTNPLTAEKNAIPRSEFEALSQWINEHEERERPASPEASPMDMAKLVFQNPRSPGGTEHVQPPQPPVDPMEGMLPVERMYSIDESIDPRVPNVRYRENLSYEEFQGIVRRMSNGNRPARVRSIGNMLGTWLRTLRSNYYGGRRDREVDFSYLRWSPGVEGGEFNLSWSIERETVLPGTRRTAPGMANQGPLVLSNQIEVIFTPWNMSSFNSEEARKVMIGALRDGLNPRSAVSDEELEPLIGSIDTSDFDVLVRNGPPPSVHMVISPRLLAAFRLERIGGNVVTYPTTPELVENHYGVPAGQRSPTPYPPDWTYAMSNPLVDASALQGSKETWNSIVTSITSMLYNFKIRTSAHQYPSDGEPARSRTLLLASPVVHETVEDGPRNALSPSPESALAEFVSAIEFVDNLEEWESDGNTQREIYTKEVNVPFWLAEDTERVPFV